MSEARARLCANEIAAVLDKYKDVIVEIMPYSEPKAPPLQRANDFGYRAKFICGDTVIRDIY